MKQDGKLTLVLNKTAISSVERAFEAFTNPIDVSKWFTASAEAELIVGGRYSNADGDHGNFLTFNPPRLVEFTWENEKHCPGTVVRVAFVKGTDRAIVVRLEHSLLQNEAVYDDMNGGWSWALDSFVSYLETGKPISNEEWLLQNPRRKIPNGGEYPI